MTAKELLTAMGFEHEQRTYTADGNVIRTVHIVTHHLPSFRSVPEEFKGSELNPAYASDLEAFILEKKPAIWMHGHTHKPCDYMIGDTRVICNPKGYLGERDQGYNPNLLIEV